MVGYLWLHLCAIFAVRSTKGSSRILCEIELTFKRSCEIADRRGEEPLSAAFLISNLFELMEIYIYSDESGVLDQKHNEFFVFGGLMFFSYAEADEATRLYQNAENIVRQQEQIDPSVEVKASSISNKSKGKLFRSLNRYHKFGVIVRQDRVLPQIFLNKKSKQRYLDYVFKIAVKRKFQHLIKQNIINPNDVKRLRFYIDEHATATDGCYELREELEHEFKIGTFNPRYSKFHEPIFKTLNSVDLKFCDSKVKTLIRAADIVANRIYFSAVSQNILSLNQHQNLFFITQP